MSERLNDLTRKLHQLGERLRKAQPESAGIISDGILHQLDQVIDLLREHSDAAYASGQDWLTDLFTHRPQLSPAVDRELLWYLGGDCLHFLSDEEIGLFQQLDELEAAAEATGEVFDREQVRKTLTTGQQFNA